MPRLCGQASGLSSSDLRVEVMLDRGCRVLCECLPGSVGSGVMGLSSSDLRVEARA